MLDINAIFQKAQKDRTDTSVMFKTAKQSAKAKITIEIPGQEPVVFNDLDEYMVFTRFDEQMGCVSATTFLFMLRVLKELKENIDKAIASKLAGKCL